ncbi:hypothetical protein [Paenibacillus qinlingensis]|uniref:hypothetical protein n=1 Tax=Paenibacillus qinlingensis TaxID=1837343 RepID=UPI00286E6FBD|nr:hypothetical protein [Paenibacillus qinlingensis]
MYGTADAVILLYTIGELPPEGSIERERLVTTLQGLGSTTLERTGCYVHIDQ